MSPSATALLITLAIVGIGSWIGFRAGASRRMDLEQWTVANRGFGVVLVWLLMAGEVYTTFSFLGASGWAYSRGGPTLYILSYLTLGYVVSFYILPQLWEAARAQGLQTQSDFFEKRYDSKVLAALVAAVGVVFIVPYLQLQLKGMGIIVEVASFSKINQTAAMVIGGALVAGFVFTSGIRAVALVSVLKDVLLLGAALVIGLAIPYHWFGGFGPMFKEIARLHPLHLTMPGPTHTMGHGWFISTVLLTSLGVYMWPHNFGASFTARSSDTLRRNAVVMPLYTLLLPLIFFAGFAAILVVPGLKDGDLSLLTVVQKTFPPWFLGVVGGAGALTAMVPSAILILTASTLFAKNFFRPIFAPSMSDDSVAKLARTASVVLMAVALLFAVSGARTIVALLLLGYAGVTQFFPGVVLGLYWGRASRSGVFSGLVVGIATVTFLTLSGRDPFMGLNAGFVALILNFAVTVVVSLLGDSRRRNKA
ncbi:MAG TPA: sodium:solute symporter family protein [Terriglobia bacterium]|nr:sodium:solute symporter family protein [Terriglobia bacterium]HKT12901.1 sodium:solute symporter family protein [Terriglobia bacterium]